MRNWLKKVLGLYENDKKAESIKKSSLTEKEKAIKDLKRINKRFRFIIEADNINLVIRDIDKIRTGK